MALGIEQLRNALVFKFDVMGEKQVMGALTGMLKRVGNLRPVWPKLDAVLREDIANTFDSEGGSKYPWPALSEYTVHGRELLGFPGAHPILVRMGRLKSSLIFKSHGDHIYNVGDKFMEMGTKVPYAAFHQSPAPRTKIPRRPMIYIDAKTVSRMVQAIRVYLNPGLSSGGLGSWTDRL